LRAALTKIISEDYHYFSYSCVWEALEDTDSDPDNDENIILTYSGNSYPKVFLLFSFSFFLFRNKTTTNFKLKISINIRPIEIMVLELKDGIVNIHGQNLMDSLLNHITLILIFIIFAHAIKEYPFLIFIYFLKKRKKSSD